MFFRMPLWQHYTQQMKKSPLADLNNISLTPGQFQYFSSQFETFKLLIRS